MDQSIVTPRLSTPRTKIPAGSVGIGGEQTGIYPLESPGGWRLIGKTPVKPYDPKDVYKRQVSDRIRSRVAESNILADIMGSDHCPVELILKTEAEK